MKKQLIVLVLVVLSVSFAHSQAFSGKGDNKFQVGANLQDNGSGLNLSYDHGLGENISIGISGTYLLSVNEALDADFGERVDLKARFNANLGNVLKIDRNFDLYPGLSLGLHNFGGHLGARYFFTNGFGLYTELNTPLAKYDTGDLTSEESLNNQFTVNIGMVFNI
jgi:hypothetical protein